MKPKTIISKGESDVDVISKTELERLLSNIYKAILPQHNIMMKDNDMLLSLKILQAIQQKKIALCGVEAGNSRLYAYILAAIVNNLFRSIQSTTIIATTSSSYQKILISLISGISDILVTHHIISRGITYTIRKGKKHYVCYERLKTYRASSLNNGIEDQELLKILNQLYNCKGPIDLDQLPITNYVKKRICVLKCSPRCPHMDNCRYQLFIERCTNGKFDFQFISHNLLLMDSEIKSKGEKGLLTDHGIVTVIIDDAHKLPLAAYQVYSQDFSELELYELAQKIEKVIIEKNHANKKAVTKLCEEITQKNTKFFADLKREINVKDDHYEIDWKANKFRQQLNALNLELNRLSVLFFASNSNEKFILKRIDESKKKIDMMLHPQYTCRIEFVGQNLKLFIYPKQCNIKLLWDLERAYVFLAKEDDIILLKQQMDIVEERLIEINQSFTPVDKNHKIAKEKIT